MAGFARLRAPRGVTEADVTSIGPGMLGTSFGRMQALVQARNAAQAERIAQQNALMEAVLARFRSAVTKVSRPGAIAEAGAAGELTRPWPGVYKGSLKAGRTVPKSYRNPRVFDLTEYE